MFRAGGVSLCRINVENVYRVKMCEWILSNKAKYTYKCKWTHHNIKPYVALYVFRQICLCAWQGVHIMIVIVTE